MHTILMHLGLIIVHQSEALMNSCVDTIIILCHNQRMINSSGPIHCWIEPLLIWINDLESYLEDFKENGRWEGFHITR